MKIFLAGATGVMGTRLVPLLMAAGHEVVGLTRKPERVDALVSAGAVPVVGDVCDTQAMAVAIAEHRPHVVMHQVTDLPARKLLLPLKLRALNRVRTEGTTNLVAAANHVGARVVAQSVAFPLPGIARRAVESLESTVLGAQGVVIRYGMFYGPGTWHDQPPGASPVVHVDSAARQTVKLVDAESGIYTVVDLDDGND